MGSHTWSWNAFNVAGHQVGNSNLITPSFQLVNPDLNNDFGIGGYFGPALGSPIIETANDGKTFGALPYIPQLKTYIERRANGGPWVRIAVATSDTYLDTDIVEDVIYEYRTTKGV
jgi:hypothetical protein